jgi:hypothetical protein
MRVQPTRISLRSCGLRFLGELHGSDPETRDLVRGCIPALLVLLAIATAVIVALWWWLSN